MKGRSKIATRKFPLIGQLSKSYRERERDDLLAGEEALEAERDLSRLTSRSFERDLVRSLDRSRDFLGDSRFLLRLVDSRLSRLSSRDRERLSPRDRLLRDRERDRRLSRLRLRR